jgi:transcriptional regulator with XRE-family HTH domain
MFDIYLVLYHSVNNRDLTTQFLPTYLRTYRKRTGLTQAEVSYVIGINRSDLWQFETSRREPSLRVLLALQVLYRIPIRKLFIGLFLHCRRKTLRRLQLLRRRLLADGKHKKSRLHIQKLGWMSMCLGPPSPAPV